MKTLRFLGITLLMVMLAVNFTACSDNEDEPSGNDEPTIGLSEKKITQIVALNDYTISLNYNNNRLSKFTWQYHDDPNDWEFNQEITYSENQVIMTGEVDGSNSKQVYTLNSQGYVSSCTTIDFDENREINTIFEYTQDGYLAKILEKEVFHGEFEDDFSTETTVLTYTDEKLVQTSNEYNSGNNSFPSKEYFSFSYSIGHVNKSKILNPIVEEYIFNYLAAYYAGILGKTSKILPDSYLSTELEDSNNLIYIFDNDGYVTNILCGNDEYIYTYSE